jgi:hypothetical protein
LCPLNIPKKKKQDKRKNWFFFTFRKKKRLNKCKEISCREFIDGKVEKGLNTKGEIIQNEREKGKLRKKGESW